MTKQCPQCGVALRDEDPAGLCPACLFGGAVETLLTVGAAAGTHSGTNARSVDGDYFGPYQLLRSLGEGGMGSVYLAEQTRPIRRQVALKVVKLGMDSRQVLARFESERQSLALMDHPNIAHVFDAGTSDNGRPYFVMEYVDGVPITGYCDQHRLSTRERLQLFIPVCQALQHAHQKGVIHRDVKPSNILVGTQDGKPVPKVIDFGIAKATDQRIGEGGAFTQLGQFVGTPEYMSPEQADLTSLNVDTSTDVYSLGVVLYELLVGALPFDPKFLRKAGVPELLRIIREEDAPPPSAKLTSLGETGTEIAQSRRTDVRSLRRDLTGDLNWIVMKAIEKERRRRYASASELAADIQRHLDDQAVLASPPSTLYTTRKFVRRHKAGVAGAACVAAALVAGIIGIAWEAQVARQERAVAIAQRQEADVQRQEAEAQRQRAETQSALALTERGRAEAMATEAQTQRDQAETQRKQAEGLFDNVRGLAGSMLFKVDDQIAELQGATPARETLVKEATAYLDRLADGSRSNPQLRRDLAAAYLKVGDLQDAPERPNLHDRDGAQASYTKALELAGPLSRGAIDPTLQHVLITAYLHRAPLQDSRDAHDDDLERALQLAESFAHQQPKSLQARRDLAMALVGSADLEARTTAKEKVYRRALAIEESVLADVSQSPDDRCDLAGIEQKLGNLLGIPPTQYEYWAVSNVVATNPAQAREWYRKSLATLEQLTREYPANAQYRRNHANVMADDAMLKNSAKQLDEALGQMRRAITLQQDLTAGDPRNIGFRIDLATFEARLSFMLGLAGKRDEGKTMADRSFAVIERLAAEQPKSIEIRADIASFNDMLSSLWYDLSNYANSARFARIALARYEELERAQPGRLRWRRSMAFEHISIGRSLFYNRGNTAGSNDRAAGVEEFRQAVVEMQRIRETGHGDSNDLAWLAGTHWDYGAFLSSAGNEAVSADQYHQAIAIYDQLTSTQRGRERYTEAITYLYSNLALHQVDNQKWEQAASYARKALPLAEGEYAQEPNMENLMALSRLLQASGSASFHLGDTAKASDQFQRLVAVAEGSAARNPSDAERMIRYVWSLETMAQFQRESGDRAGVVASYQRATAVLDRLGSENLSSVGQRGQIAGAFRRIARGSAAVEDYPTSASTIRKSIAILEPMFKDEPPDSTRRGPLRESYPVLAKALWMVGDLAGARDNFLAPLILPGIGGKPFKLNTGGDYQYSLARVRGAMGDAVQATQDFHKSLDWYRRAEAGAEKLWAASQVDLTVLGDLIVAQQGIADLLERFGQPQEALDYGRKALANQVIRSAKGTGEHADFQEALESARAAVARLEWEDSGSNSQRLAHLDVARGYRALGALRTEQMDLVLANEALAKALEMDTALLAEIPRKPEYRLEMALTLQSLGTLHRRRNEPSAARESSTHARSLVLELAREHALPDRYFTLPGLLAVDIASADALAARPDAVSRLQQ